MICFGIANNGHSLTHEMYDDDTTMISHVQTVWMAFMVLCFLFILFTGILGGYHMYLLVSGQTTWEHSSRNSVTYLRPYKTGILPFYEGLYENIRHAFQPKEPKDWELLEPSDLLEKQGFNWCENEYWSCC
jgi:palmitoyltransferase